ncbi:MAG TPA: xanthine dehydrogenase family protein molybdopterin-binding subunit [Gaiellaceae bacterium]|nr:xanthine dehydrogenase family protein molybdopterin-binding subunit [Gaiellaceae bacterium]
MEGARGGRITLVGSDVPRREDLPLLTGAGCFVGDLDLPGQLWARVVRSPVAHGRITRLDVEAARAAPGVAAVLTAADLPDVRLPIRLPFAETPEAVRALQPPLARDVVRYVGEPIALVVAADPYAAEDAAELVFPELDELPPVLDLAAAEEAEPIHAGLGSNLVNRLGVRHGDVDAAFAAADLVVAERLELPRLTAVPLETRGVVAEYSAEDDRLTLWGATKVKHFNRAALAAMLELPVDRVRLLEVDVGGGFGVRGELYPEDVVVAFAARHLRRPVKWIEDRHEHLLATNHAREQVHEVEVAAAADGTLLAFRDWAWCDQGAYVRTQGILPPALPIDHLPGPYGWRAFEIESAGVVTNRTPVGTVRGPGMTEAAFVRERMVDLVARRLGLDPTEIRRRNLIPADRIPWSFDRDPWPPVVYDSGDFPAFFDRLLDRAGYGRLRATQARRRARGESVGIGVATYMEINAIGPLERATITPTPDAGYIVRVGVASLGQGLATALGQIAADELGAPFDHVEIRHHDTDDVPEGFGTFASRSTVLAGNAIAVAAADLRRRASEAGIDARDASAAAAAGLVGEGTYERAGFSFSFGAHLACATVDRETGNARIERYLVAHDVGRAVNPALVRGQLAGAAAQGIGAALLERLAYDEHGQPLSASLADYLLPTAGDVPGVDVLVIEHPTDSNPLGLKGGGEGGMAGTLAAVANAVEDALGPDAATVRTLPLSPSAVRALLLPGGAAAAT